MSTVRMSKREEKNLWRFRLPHVFQFFLSGSLAIGMLWLKISYDSQLEELNNKLTKCFQSQSGITINTSDMETVGINDTFFHMLRTDVMTFGDSKERTRRSTESLTRVLMTALKTLCEPGEKYCLPGQKGDKGEAGAQGQPGYPGYDGAPGQQGERGEKGEAREGQGQPGQPGQPGKPGEKGSKGDRGSKGSAGNQTIVKGSKGEPGLGLPGIQGNNGRQGERGPRGEAGKDGLPGVNAKPGPLGSVGPEGKRGERGETGLQGRIGKPGPAGMTGPQGRKGEIGQNGLKGVKGDKGNYGSKGQKGETGILPPSALPAQCSNYRILNEAWRRVSNTAAAQHADTTSTSCGGSSGLTDGWYRYERHGRTRKMIDTCPSGTSYLCGSDEIGWLQGGHPRVIGEEVQRTVCFHYSGNCCKDPINIRVTNCQSFYVYYFKQVGCYKVYCFDG